ncbi:hypothetical protein CKY20_11060 [Capnocytophaga canis]|uniref:Teneurin-like YD-shell domain-containing protein n=1 Tax=Capnocytophaga canis TaxID=1848903 RepID=A0A3A1YCH1_9FLAO|nr:RHS repeat-associated core domain-containing protein [Capnocytophaga canis]RIY35241.1 hypothetical protein CKY20_11060 [Capnocytophaga canis]
MRIQRPDGSVITFKYDAFGRRIEKKTARATTHFVWDGNIPLHEWKTFDYRETTDNDRITWIFQDFVPVAKLQGDKSYSIISDHIGTPLVAIDNEGVKVWERELDIYGKVRKLQGDKWFMPFLYQGQYYDVETELAYNRFRYYSPDIGAYISQDPIGLLGNNPTLYGYVFDTNTWVDILGLIIVFRGMDSENNGKPIIHSGETTNGNNAANSLGVRIGESGMSTSTTIKDIQPHRKSPDFGGTRKSSTMYSLDTDVLDKYGLIAIKDGDTHVSIKVKEGISQNELGKRLAETQSEWKKVEKEKVCTT